MAEAKKERVKLITPLGRLTFPSIFNRAKPMQNEPQDKETKFEATIVFDVKYLKANPEELKRFNEIKKHAEGACVGLFKKSIKDCKIRIDKFNDPIRDGIQKEHLAGYGEGTIFMKATSKRRPGVMQKVNGQSELILDPEAVYSGCYVRLNVTPYAYDNVGKGVAFALNSVMFVRDGERLDGTSNPEEDFGEIDGETVEVGSGDNDDLI